MWRISTGVSAIRPLLEPFEQGHEHALDDQEHEDRDHRRQVERTERRQEAAKDPQVRVADVVEEPLHAVEPRPVGEPDPRREDVREQQEQVHPQKDVDEVRERVAHERPFAALRPFPTRSYAWLKKPPRSSIRARSSADTSTLRGVNRKTLSATRCIPPSRAYVRPLAKSISR